MQQKSSQPPARRRKHRLAASVAFATLFFAGAAFSAGAGDVVVSAVEQATTEAASAEEQPVEDTTTEETTTEDTTTTETTPTTTTEEPTDEEPTEEPVEEPTEEPTDDGGSSGGSSGGGVQPSSPPSQSGGQGNDGSPSGNGPQSSPSTDGGKPASDGPVLVAPESNGPTQLDPEADAEGSFATVWLHRLMPDPTPPATRLSPGFAKTLVRESREAHVGWPVVLAVLRGDGFRGGSTSAATVDRAAERLAELGVRKDAWRAFLAYKGRTSFADRALALTRYNRAVGLRPLVTGFQAAKQELRRAVLADKRLDIYSGGRADIEAGRINVRVLVLLRYLAEAHGQVTVSSLQSGHGFYTKSGNVSAHSYGLAVDVSSLDGRSIAGNQGRGGLAERAVRNILLLPVELRPKQVISLLGLGGPSFPMADHWDHIHVGY